MPLIFKPYRYPEKIEKPDYVFTPWKNIIVCPQGGGLLR